MQKKKGIFTLATSSYNIVSRRGNKRAWHCLISAALIRIFEVKECQNRNHVFKMKPAMCSTINVFWQVFKALSSIISFLSFFLLISKAIITNPHQVANGIFKEEKWRLVSSGFLDFSYENAFSKAKNK